MMLLTIDLGNTSVKCAVFEQNTLLKKCVFDTKDVIKNFEKIFNLFPNITKVISSSVGKLDDNVILFLKKKATFFEVSHDTSFPFYNQYKTPKTLGVDRMVLVAGAVLQFPNSNCLIIDAGTCVTYDFVDSHRSYFGGAISPGLQMRYKSLHTYTAKLPLLDVTLPESFIGNETNQAIHSGVVNGLVYEIEGFVSQYLLKNQDLTIILTGGDADFLAKSLKSTIFANPNFLLESLNLLFTYCTQEND